MRCGTTILLALLTLLLVLSLTSCSATNGAQSSEAEVTGPLTEDYDDAPPIITQLVVGTIRLGNGDLAVDAAQAAELLPLWKAYRGLSASDSSSSLELEALVEQIQETMTTEQIEAIAQMVTAKIRWPWPKSGALGWVRAPGEAVSAPSRSRRYGRNVEEAAAARASVLPVVREVDSPAGLPREADVAAQAEYPALVLPEAAKPPARSRSLHCRPSEEAQAGCLPIARCSMP